MASRNDIKVLSIVLLIILCSPIDAQEYHDAQDDSNPPLGIIPIGHPPRLGALAEWAGPSGSG